MGDLIQFVPKEHQTRPNLSEAKELEAAEFLKRAPALAISSDIPDTSPSEMPPYVADEKDGA